MLETTESITAGPDFLLDETQEGDQVPPFKKSIFFFLSFLFFIRNQPLRPVEGQDLTTVIKIRMFDSAL